MVHVDEEGEIERSPGQARVVRLAADEGDRAGQPFGVDPLGQPVEIFGDDVLGVDVSLRHPLTLPLRGPSLSPLKGGEGLLSG